VFEEVEPLEADCKVVVVFCFDPLEMLEQEAAEGAAASPWSLAVQARILV
jgi:hypothetical protein